MNSTNPEQKANHGHAASKVAEKRKEKKQTRTEYRATSGLFLGFTMKNEICRRTQRRISSEYFAVRGGQQQNHGFDHSASSHQVLIT